MHGVLVNRLAKRFGATIALDNVDLVIAPGEVHGLLGRNGAGKSTLLRILATSVIPDGGTATIEGFDVCRQSAEVRRRIGLVSGEDRAHFWRLSGRHNLEFFAALRGLSRPRALRAAAGCLAAVGLSDVAELRVDRYSTGMRSRLGIARALLGAPSVLLLDEPTRSLDPAAAGEVRGLLRDLAQDRGCAVLLATHDLHEAASIADQVSVLSRGAVAARCPGRTSPADLQDVVVGSEG